MYSFLIAAAVTMCLFIFLGVRSAKKVKNESDYSVAGRKATAAGVSGILLGAIIGGASTVGTVQMAYSFGVSAWWFTLGGGIGCFILAIWFARPLRRSGVVTIPAYLEKNYGSGVSTISMLSTSMGTFISIVAQFLAGTALFRTVFSISAHQAVIILGVLILTFIFLGGLKSYSSIGKAKIVLLFLILLTCVIVACLDGYTPMKLVNELPARPWLNIFGRGMEKDIGACLSLIVGVMCTQIYLQGVFAASDENTARKGVLLAAATMPVLGFLGVWIGLAMRASGVIVEPSHALPEFIRMHFSPVIAGIMWGGLLIVVIGAAAGLSLGVATNLVRDIYMPLKKRFKRRKEENLLTVSRLVVLAIVVMAAWLGSSSRGSLILQWSYLSMALRGAGTCFPLMLAVLCPHMLPRKWALASSLGGLGAMLICPLIPIAVEPLFAGLFISGGLALGGAFLNRDSGQKRADAI